MSPYRILHLITSLHVGGSGRLLLRNLRATRAQDLEHRVAYLVPRHDLVPEMQAAGWEPECLGHRRRLDGPRTLLRLVRLIQRNRIDLLHTNLPLDRFYGGLAGLLTHRPVVATLHDASNPDQLRAIGGYRLAARLRRFLEHRIVHRFLAVSGMARKAHVQWHGLPEDRVEVLPSGIPLEPFQAPNLSVAAQTLRQSLGLEPQDIVLLNVGRLHSFKGQILLVHLMPKILQHWPTARLLIAGRGPERETLEQTVRELGLEGQHVRLLGRRDDIPALLAAANLFLFPSRTEALPLALLEAMAAGRAIVASNIDSIRSVLTDRVTGRLAPPEDADAWAKIVLELLAHPEIQKSLGAAARETVSRDWDIRQRVKDLELMYHQMLLELR